MHWHQLGASPLTSHCLFSASPPSLHPCTQSVSTLSNYPDCTKRTQASAPTPGSWSKRLAQLTRAVSGSNALADLLPKVQAPFWRQCTPRHAVQEPLTSHDSKMLRSITL